MTNTIAALKADLSHDATHATAAKVVGEFAIDADGLNIIQMLER